MYPEEKLILLRDEVEKNDLLLLLLKNKISLHLYGNKSICKSYCTPGFAFV